MGFLKTQQWKKNRKFGDVYGGRLKKKRSDNIFFRLHSLERPSPSENLPILITENPSRNFFHPISAEEAAEAVNMLPNNDGDGITHIWLRRITDERYHNAHRPLAEFICGSGVRVIVLYPWATSMELIFEHKPSNRFVKELDRFGISIHRRKRGYYVKPNLSQLRKFYVQSLLFHEVGHHVDEYYRHWSKANMKETEEFADQYAMQMSGVATKVLKVFESR